MDTLTSIKVLRQVVELGSFVAAAERLNLSTAMVSKHVMHLERNLGTRLLNRTSRHLSLTEAGTIYYEHCREMLDNLEMVEAQVRQSTGVVRGALKISAPVWFANPLFTKILAEYRSQYPYVLLDLNLNDRIVNLAEEGFDLALRVSHDDLRSSLPTRRICPIQFMLVGSPDYFQRNGRPKNLDELAKHTGISYYYSQFADQLFFDSSDRREMVKLAVSLRTNNTIMEYQAASAGIGLALLPEWLIKDDLTSQRLEMLDLGHIGSTASLWAVYASRRYLSPRIETFLGFLVERFSSTTEL